MVFLLFVFYFLELSDNLLPFLLYKSKKTFKTEISVEFRFDYHSQILGHSPLTVDVFYVSVISVVVFSLT